MAKGGFQVVELDSTTLAELDERARDFPLDGFQYAVSRFLSQNEIATPREVRDDLGGKSGGPTASKLEGIPAIAGKFGKALSRRSIAVSQQLTQIEHRYGEAGLVCRIERDLERFLDLCEMARREAELEVRPGRAPDKNTELVRDLARALRLTGIDPDASQGGPLVQAFDIAHAFARKQNSATKQVKDTEGTVRKALAVLGKE